MSRFRAQKFHAEVHTSAMNDIMFFLLLFFLIVSTLVNPSVIKLMLPKAQSTQALNKQNITLSIDANKTYTLNKKTITSDQLEAELELLSKSINEASVIVRIDKSLSVQDLVDVLQVGNKLKLKMLLATDK